MKKSTIVIFFVLVMLNTQAQDYFIDFAGTGASATVDSVQVKNLAQNTSLTLNGADVLHLMGVVGIGQETAQTKGDLFIYPNPMVEQGFIEFETASAGKVQIGLCDISGKQVVQIQPVLPAGIHTFAVNGLNAGIYTLGIRLSAAVYSGKIASAMTGPGSPVLRYLSSDHGPKAPGRLKSLKSLVPMQYDDGDQLLFTCFSGTYKTVIPLIPVQSQTVTSNFVACADADGNNYATVSIGAQTWMAENLKVGIRIDGVQEQTDNGVIEKYCYYNNEWHCDIYGGLYQWHEMMQYVTTEGVQGICPTGWHIPTHAEWITLTNYLGGIYVAGGKMKSTGTIEAGTGLWHDPNTGATSESGFMAVPAGYSVYNGAFDYIGYSGYWWGSSMDYAGNVWSRYLSYYDSSVYSYCNTTYLGFSVRCLRDF